VELRAIQPDDVDAVQELIESDPGYTERITGYPPGSSDAQSLLMMRPGSIPEDAKVVLGAWEDDELVAVVDLLRGYPNESTAFIGLLEVHGKHQRCGRGAAAYGLVEQYVAGTWPEVEKLRLAVVDTNADTAVKFWVAMGFRQTGEAKPYRYDKLESVARLYEKQLAWSHPNLEVRTSQIEGDGLFARRPAP
jgi:ribosomal protein S18 acetylase RimI-like enzyme